MARKLGFTILELILVLGVLSALILMSRSFFTNPNNDVLQSEVCINKISTQIEGFFNNAITGKGYLNGAIQPNTYTLRLQYTNSPAWNAINLYTDSNPSANNSTPTLPAGSYSIFENFWSPSSSSDIASDCQNKKFIVLLHGEYPKPNKANIADLAVAEKANLAAVEKVDGALKINNELEATKVVEMIPSIDISSFIQDTITINKNLASSIDNPGGISICKGAFPCTGTDNKMLSYTITYRVCSKYKDNTTINDSNCIHTYSNRIDVATQSVKSNKCLGIDRSTNKCNKRSIDNF